jgi:glycosyltransferase involved in cell wall biosynthesis
MLIFDISTLASAGGQAVGVVRVMRELAIWAYDHRLDVAFVLYDTKIEAYCQIQPRWTKALVDGSAMVDMSILPSRGAEKSHLRDRLSGPLRMLALWIQHPRRRAIMALERRRLTARTPTGARRAARLQSALLSPRYRQALSDSLGRRRDLLPYDMTVSAPVELTQNDILLFAGWDWGTTNVALLREHKRRSGFKISILYYDIIPLLYPTFYLSYVVAAFREFLHVMVPVADLVIVTSKRVELDLKHYCKANGLGVPKTRIVELGADPPAAEVASNGTLPGGLQPGLYALFVSTLEPRKGHRLLFSVWKRLLAEGVPQARGFKLVFVGRRGWLVDDLLAEFAADPCVGDSLLILSGITDAALATLYRGAAFCVYPSLYEGYGLPIVEAFRYGKAVLSSRGGALPEIVGDLSPCLDPLDEQAWYETLKCWIIDPAARAGYEDAIRERFRHPTWPQASEAFFGVLDQELR